MSSDERAQQRLDDVRAAMSEQAKEIGTIEQQIQSLATRKAQLQLQLHKLTGERDALGYVLQIDVSGAGTGGASGGGADR